MRENGEGRGERRRGEEKRKKKKKEKEKRGEGEGGGEEGWRSGFSLMHNRRGLDGVFFNLFSDLQTLLLC